MDNKYYTPDTKDLYTGYECELLRGSGDNTTWTPYIIQVEENSSDGDFIRVHNKESIRTPYLTKEQIEAEGWKFEKNGKFEFIFRHTENTSEGVEDYLLYLYKFGGVIPWIKIENRWEQRIRSSCPSINEFRTICKLLGIPRFITIVEIW